MMHLTMFREASVDGATLSKLFIGLEFVCDILEDEVREVVGQRVSDWKVKEKTAIPAGTYPITLVHSNRFGPDTLTLNDVPGFLYIRIHGGNTQFHTEGCLLPGTRNTANTVAGSQVALKKLRDLVVPMLKAGGPVTIEILNPSMEA
jgi:hypothetical protein